jgi:hypothetical protein
MGLELLRIDAAEGDPFPRAWLPLLPLPRGGLRRGLFSRVLEELFRIIGLSLCGDSPNISSKEVEALNDVLAPRVWNLNGGA